MTAPVPTDDDLVGIDDGTTYAEAVVELDQILRELEDDRIDVDALATRVRRAAVLLRFCRGRIADAKLEIEKVVADLSAFDDLEGDAAGEAAGGVEVEVDADVHPGSRPPREPDE